MDGRWYKFSLVGNSSDVANVANTGYVNTSNNAVNNAVNDTVESDANYVIRMLNTYPTDRFKYSTQSDNINKVSVPDSNIISDSNPQVIEEEKHASSDMTRVTKPAVKLRTVIGKDSDGNNILSEIEELPKVEYIPVDDTGEWYDKPNVDLDEFTSAEIIRLSLRPEWLADRTLYIPGRDGKRSEIPDFGTIVHKDYFNFDWIPKDSSEMLVKLNDGSTYMYQFGDEPVKDGLNGTRWRKMPGNWIEAERDAKNDFANVPANYDYMNKRNLSEWEQDIDFQKREMEELAYFGVEAIPELSLPTIKRNEKGQIVGPDKTPRFEPLSKKAIVQYKKDYGSYTGELYRIYGKVAQYIEKDIYFRFDDNTYINREGIEYSPELQVKGEEQYKGRQFDRKELMEKYGVLSFKEANENFKMKSKAYVEKKRLEDEEELEWSF